jgi:multisubunit Na+/H+ antiporter MnhE subunit
MNNYSFDNIIVDYNNSNSKNWILFIYLFLLLSMCIVETNTSLSVRK